MYNSYSTDNNEPISGEIRSPNFLVHQTEFQIDS